MQHVMEQPDLHVLDDVLTSESFRDLWLLMNALPYRSTSADRWAPVWNLQDGYILRANPYVANAHGQPRSETAIDGLVDRVITAARKLPALEAFARVTVIPYVWPAGTGISWHADGTNHEGRLGAFTFYAHRTWNAEWGGELFITSARGNVTLTPFDNSDTSDIVMNGGLGTWIAPKPNRLVLLAGDTLHKVNRTMLGAAPRLSIQGFLSR